MGFEALAQIVQVMTHPAVLKMLQPGLQRFLGRLLTGKAAPCPVPTSQQVTCCSKFPTGLAKPIDASIHDALLPNSSFYHGRMIFDGSPA
jgi:hypothetical protein